ncbi:MAG TPA: sigma-54-dependent Fis family transcriptional regulator [Rheinheimera sp.]|uniref:sigma-54-dependent transcriptional regulator n=1 Tax=Rheinheimera sp. TaxID=1869214 RepID=UPI000ECD35A5|nr:sigma-54 dependent transcriptional regulator [Rheinheimera sp.]HCU64643.1 sigma-54-dependent Fis family transcriptional regulator [Rheinheimera sp.]
MTLERFDIARILLVDDEPAFRLLAERFLTQQGHQVVSVADLATARTQLAAQSFDLILLDLSLPPAFDPQATLLALAEFTAQPVIIMTGHAERELALKAISLGAWDFLAKPVDPDMLAVVVKRAISKHQLSRELTLLKRHHQPTDVLSQLVGVSRQMDNIRTLVQRIAPTEVRVLVTGPSGTGKEVVSRVLHQLSLRSKGPFVSVHCGAIPAELLESELFGYVKGAFTGADKDRQGLLSLANGGTLFLDEIGEMPLPMQVKMLRVLQEGTFYPVGGREQKQIDVRLISATNAVLPELVRQGKFREDLYYRIKGITLETPALDERREDIPLLIQRFLQQHPADIQLSPEAMAWFLQQTFPGNVRELKNTLESVLAIAQGGVVTLSDIQLLHLTPQQTPAATPLLASPGLSLDEQVRQLEVSLLTQALLESQGNRSQAARVLGLSRQGLLKKIERYGLQQMGG